MDIILIGLNHKTAPIGIREQFYLQPLERELLLSELKNSPQVVEVFVLSTCNRTEIYAHLISEDSSILFDTLYRIKKDIYIPDLSEYFYIKKNEEAIHHFFEVTCGLNSLVVGEKQILGQVKSSAELAHRMGVLGKIFNVLINTAIHAGKIVQTKTQIGCGGSSVSWAAVAMAQKILCSFENKSILVIGAGKMSQLTASQLIRKSVQDIFVMNRTFEKAQELAQKIGGQAVTFLDLKNILARIDVCICSAGASYFLIDSEAVYEVMKLRGGKPLLLIDISTPRNINPDVARIPNVQLLSIDDLHKVIDDNLQSRYNAISSVKEIIKQKVALFYKKIIKAGYLQTTACTH
ncbi:MAG: glutamyl-tRNA reductase [Candidatus Omnitrophica bacterium]|nr:glutamyl-tRNA reductase [Candidatus Omnitrophota bacterium]